MTRLGQRVGGHIRLRDVDTGQMLDVRAVRTHSFGTKGNVDDGICLGAGGNAKHRSDGPGSSAVSRESERLPPMRRKAARPIASFGDG